MKLWQLLSEETRRIVQILSPGACYHTYETEMDSDTIVLCFAPPMPNTDIIYKEIPVRLLFKPETDIILWDLHASSN